MHIPRLEQPEEVVQVKLAFSKEMYMNSAIQVVTSVVKKVASGLAGIFKGSELQSYQQHQLVYNKIKGAVKVNSVFMAAYQ